jgi:hypothetical protein
LNEPDAIYCEVDGSALKAAPPPPPPSAGILVLPDQSEVQLSQSRRTFGRADFIRFLKPGQDPLEVSRAHFTISQDGGVCYIEDGGPDPANPQTWKQSQNQTFVNLAALQPGERKPLKPNDAIDVAHLVTLTFRTR